MSCFECANFEQKLAFHTAPALLGIKSANLISLKCGEFDIDANVKHFNRRADSKGLRMKILCSCEKHTLVLVYSKNRLAKQLADPERKALLQTFGYDSAFTLEEYLEKLSERISESNDFPHEIGLFLEYPIEDVVGFIENKGDNFKLCGYWKVYGNPEKARRTFDNYNKCRKFLCNKLSQGNDIYQALHIS
jgi:hypothetical protein